jgi:hypothetical protein
MAESMYRAPALTEHGPGIWNFGFFSLSNGLRSGVQLGPRLHGFDLDRLLTFLR